MELMTLARVAEIVGADAPSPAETVIGPGVVIDSRQVTPGALFVALPGERTDGHDHLAAARSRARSAIVTRLVDDRLPRSWFPTGWRR